MRSTVICYTDDVSNKRSQQWCGPEGICDLCDARRSRSRGWEPAISFSQLVDGVLCERVVFEYRRSYWVRKGGRTRRLPALWERQRGLPDIKRPDLP